MTSVCILHIVCNYATKLTDLSLLLSIFFRIINKKCRNYSRLFLSACVKYISGSVKRVEKTNVAQTGFHFHSLSLSMFAFIMRRDALVLRSRCDLRRAENAFPFIPLPCFCKSKMKLDYLKLRSRFNYQFTERYGSSETKWW